MLLEAANTHSPHAIAAADPLFSSARLAVDIDYRVVVVLLNHCMTLSSNLIVSLDQRQSSS
jgi:hypothetical protein